MTLLTICQNVADAIPVTRPAAIIGSSDETARLLLVLANQTGKALYERHDWILMSKEHSFTTVADQEDYSLRSDYGRLSDKTVWDQDNFRQMRGPLTPPQWQYQKNAIATQPGILKRYRIRGVSGVKMFSIYPTPTDTDDCIWEYVSNNWCQSSAGAGQSAWAQDIDTGIVSEYLLELGLLWRALKRLGLDYADEKDEYNRQLDQAIARDGAAPEISITPATDDFLLGPANIPDTGYGI